MVRPNPETELTPAAETADRDERLGAAIEEYMALAETGAAPEPEQFAADHPDLSEDLLAALDGLAMVRGLVGDSGSGPGSRLEAGRRVAGYRIVRELGRGGMGIVYEAVHVDLDRPVALKVLNTHAAPDSSGRRRFLNEAKTAAGLHHTHIVPVFDVGQVGGLCYYAMQRIEGSGLDRVVKSLRKGRSTAAGSGSNKPAHQLSALDLLDATSIGDPTRSWFGASKARPGGAPERVDDAPLFEPPRGGEYYRWVAKAGAQAAEALAHAHRRGVIHRDVKPSNLLVDARGTVWVADFGLARRLADPAITQTDSLMGTPRYMSPEQTELGPVDGRTDLYSLGTTLYELLTLRPPFDGKSAAELVVQIRDKEPAPPRKLDPKLPRDLETIVMKAMAKRPSDRYAGPAELAEDLNRFLAMEPVRARRIGPVGRAWRFARRHPSLTAVSTVATVAILATATISHMKIWQERNEAVAAKNQTAAALKAVKQAEMTMRSAMRKNLWREAASIRQSSQPNRRTTSLERIKDAVRLGPDPEMTPLLRDEAVQSLSLRDIEPRPPIASGALRQLVFSPGTNRLATLKDDNSQADLWDLARREKTATHPLSEGPADESRDRRPVWMRGAAPVLTATAGFVGAIRPGGDGVRLFDSVDDTRFVDLPLPGRRVIGLAATPDGKRLVVASSPDKGSTGGPGGKVGGPGGGAGNGPNAGRTTAEPTITLWDLERSDAPIAILNEPTRPRDPAEIPTPGRRGALLIACSPESDLIALCWFGDTEITLWTADGVKLASIPTEAFTSSIALAKGGVLAAACGGSIARWDAKTTRPLPGLSLHQPFARAIRFSPDGKALGVASVINGIEIWDPEANSLLASVPTTDVVTDFTFSPDGQTLVAAVKDEIQVWATVEPVGRSRLAAPETRPASRLMHLSFSPSGSVASTFWNEKTVTARVQCPDGGVSTRDRIRSFAVGFDPRGRLIVPNGDDLEFYASPRDAEPDLRLALPMGPFSYGRTPDRDFPDVVGWARSSDGRVLLAARHTDMLMVRFNDQGEPSVVTLRFPDAPGNRNRGDLRDRGPGGGPPPGGPGTPPPGGRPDGPGGKGRGRGGDDRYRPGGDLRTLALSASGDRFYMVMGDAGEPHAWSISGDLATEVALKNLPPELVSRDARPDPDRKPADRAAANPRPEDKPGVIRMAESPDGLVLALSRVSGEVLFLSPADGAFLARIAASDQAGLATALAFSLHGELAIGYRSGVVKLWSVAHPPKPELLVSLPGPQGFVTNLAFSPDSHRLAAGDEDGADVWDLNSVRQQLAQIGLGW